MSPIRIAFLASVVFSAGGCGVSISDLFGGVWEAGSTLDVSIAPDPEALGRDELIRQGVERWRNRLEEKGLGLNVWIAGSDGPTGNVQYSWWSSQSSGWAESFSDEAGVIYGGQVFMPDQADAGIPDFIRNLAEHELVHVLGPPNVRSGSVMNGIQPGVYRPWNAADQEIWNAWYPCSSATRRALWVDSPVALETAPGQNHLGPSIATDGKGIWVAAWMTLSSQSDTQLPGSWKVLVSRSEDLGRSWSMPAIVGVVPDRGSATSLVTDRQGNWILTWQPQSDAVISAIRSRDNGITWEMIETPAQGAAHALASDDAGLWAMAWSQDNVLVLSRSTNAGKTWEQPTVVVDPAQYPFFCGSVVAEDAPHLAINPNGTWMLAWTGTEQNDDTCAGGTIYISRSADYGATWSEPARIASWLAGDLWTDTVELASDGAGNWNLISQAHEDCDGACPVMTHTMVRSSTDDGLTWSSPQDFETLNGADTPSVVTDRQGHWAAVYVGSGSAFSYVDQVRLVVSGDGGLTWGLPESIGDFRSSGTAARLVTDGQGNWICLSLGLESPQATHLYIWSNADDQACR
jgi:hypothetical protein